MKVCPICGAENWPDNNLCFSCGSDLAGAANPNAPTQPTAVHPSRPGPTTQRYSPNQAQMPAQALQQEYAAPAPIFPLHKETRDRTTWLWRVFAALLVLGLLCAGGFAIWTVSATFLNKMEGLAVKIPPPPQLPQLPWLAANTPIPTNAPNQETPSFSPSATPNPAATPDFEKYLTRECAAALDHLRVANERFSKDPMAPFDSAWRDQLSSAVSEMKTYCSSVDTASPVPNLVGEAHRDLNLATEEFDTANNLVKEGITKLEPGKIFDSGAHFQKAAGYLQKALEELNKIGKPE